MALKEGELIRYDPLEEEIEVRLIEDEEEREKAPTIGYFAMFEYANGFKKTLYWSKNKMISHADRYSQAFSANATTGRYPKVSFADYEAGKVPKGDEWLYSSFWYKDFDAMAIKTMLRQIISKWGIMSIDMQNAVQKDMAVIREDMTPDYVEEAAPAAGTTAEPASVPDQVEVDQTIVIDQPAQEQKQEAVQKPAKSLEDEFFG